MLEIVIRRHFSMPFSLKPVPLLKQKNLETSLKSRACSQRWSMAAKRKTDGFRISHVLASSLCCPLFPFKVVSPFPSNSWETYICFRDLNTIPGFHCFLCLALQEDCNAFLTNSELCWICLGMRCYRKMYQTQGLSCRKSVLYCNTSIATNISAPWQSCLCTQSTE